MGLLVALLINGFWITVVVYTLRERGGDIS